MIFLTGFSGCGKSTAGRRLAERLGCSFVDLDSEIETRAGCKIAEIFATVGEEEFRRMEHETLAEIIATAPERTVIATGGGAPCYCNNFELMSAAGTVVYLRMSPENLVLRLQKGRLRRPKLADMNDDEMLTYIRLTLSEREPYYLKAQVVIDCNGIDYTYLAEHLAFVVA